MSRHQAYRNYDYDNDLDEYDGEEEEELSPEDQALMRDATAAVRTVLGDSQRMVTDAQIQESLWHYYYDVEKTVGYLTKKFLTAPKKEQSQGSTARPWDMDHLLPPSKPASFADMPWCSVPPERQTLFLPPVLPQGGLLGGSSSTPKMSKLQLLAAQRKRKAEEAKKAKETQEAGGSADGSADGSARDAKPQPVVDVPELREKAAQLTLGNAPPAAQILSASQSVTNSSPAREERGAPDAPMEDAAGSSVVTGKQQSDAQQINVEDLIAQPSGLAQVLLGHKQRKRAKAPERMAIPSHALMPPSAHAAFMEPSPDDVVLQAQAKGWRQGQAKNALKK